MRTIFKVTQKEIAKTHSIPSGSVFLSFHNERPYITCYFLIPDTTSPLADIVIEGFETGEPITPNQAKDNYLGTVIDRHGESPYVVHYFWYYVEE